MTEEKIFYISDTHFGHENVIRFDKRPFKTTEEMENEIVRRWNGRVRDCDTVYILGDFSWEKEDKTLSILERLCGRKVLIKGNHDRVSPKAARMFEKVDDYTEIKDGGVKVVLCHYPILSWNGKFYDSVHLYGHLHNTDEWKLTEKIKEMMIREQKLPVRMFNVGCMMEYMDYTPRTLEEIIMAEKKEENE